MKIMIHRTPLKKNWTHTMSHSSPKLTTVTVDHRGEGMIHQNLAKICGQTYIRMANKMACSELCDYFWFSSCAWLGCHFTSTFFHFFSFGPILGALSMKEWFRGFGPEEWIEWHHLTRVLAWLEFVQPFYLAEQPVIVIWWSQWERSLTDIQVMSYTDKMFCSMRYFV